VFRVFRKQQLGRRARSLDLSSSFREGLDKNNTLPAEDYLRDKDEQSTLDLKPVSEELSANLDPVTERLLAIIKAKAGN
jgi:hypothetical protein